MARYLLLAATSGVPGRLKYVDDATTAPTVTDDAVTRGIGLGSLWIDTTADRVYVCTDPSEGAAVWVEAGATGALSSHVAAADPHTGYRLESAGVDLTSLSLILPQSATPTPTAEGSIAWDTDGDFLRVGDGAASLDFHPVLSGTWTPGLTFQTPGDLAVTYSVADGSWKKVGSIVHAYFRIVTSAFTFTTATGQLRITGLPFTAAGASTKQPPSPVLTSGHATLGGNAAGQAVRAIGGGTLALITIQSITTTTVHNTALWPTGSTVTIEGNITYEA